MGKKLTGRALGRMESKRNIRQEVLEGVREIKAGRGKRTVGEPNLPVARARLKAGLTHGQFAAFLGVASRAGRRRR